MAFALGGNNYGQLGIGNNIDQKDPIMITSLLNYRITELFSGENHSIAVGGLRESTNSRLSIKQSQSEENFIYNKESLVFVWGDNRFGQLGLNEFNNSINNINSNSDNKEFIYCKYSPTNLEFFQQQNKILKFIEIGQNHNLFLTTDGKIYAFGSNLNNQIINSRSKGFMIFVDKLMK